MDRVTLNDVEIAPVTVVFEAAREFASALAETPEYAAFEQAAHQLERDEEAQSAMRAFQSKRQSLNALLMLNAVDEAERRELDNLYQAFVTQPSVAAYARAQEELMALARTCAEILSTATGLDYAASCGSSCCG